MVGVGDGERAQHALERAHDREALRYLPQALLQSSSAGHVPVSSIDLSLTAFAQLGALRLNASRCLISLFDRNTQYVLAESTKTLSLQSDAVHSVGDQLWFGCCSVSRHSGPCGMLLDDRIQAMRDGTELKDEISIYSDITQEPRFKDTLLVLRDPPVRFYAGAPIITTTGYHIGSYCVIDTEARPHPPDAEIQFLRDIAITVMSHLALCKSREEHRQGESMIRGISSFVEGRATLRDWRVNEAGTRSYELGRDSGVGEGHPNKRQQTMQNESDYMTHGPQPFKPSDTKEEHTMSSSPEQQLEINRSPRLSTPGSDRSESLERKESDALYPSTAGSPRASGREASLDLLFSRAANVVREALEIEGSIFLDVSVGSFSSLIQSSTQPEHGTDSSSGPESFDSSSSTSQPSDKNDRHYCPVLGYATTTVSSINNEPCPKPLAEVPERLLRSLLKRYPRGYIFNFDSHGNLYSSTSGDEYHLHLSNRSHNQIDPKVRRRRSLDQSKSQYKHSRAKDAAMLATLLPGARSVGLIPLWDSHRERWFAGGLIFTHTPERTFSKESHLSFLGAFGSVIMSEVARIDALAEETAKSDLLGSISHELRSPLHGILGSIELIESASQTPFQADMLASVEMCGRTLLDTVDHLLDFSKINHIATSSKQDGKVSSSLSRKYAPSNGVRIDLIAEEVITTTMTGHEAQKRATVRTQNGQPPIPQNQAVEAVDKDQVYLIDKYDDRNIGHRESSQAPPPGPMVILDVDRSIDAPFLTPPGAWRRIIMNIFANALKYTSSGRIKISLSARPPQKKRDSASYRVILVISDTGRGMSKNFLQSQVFKPFAQESSLTPGTGLGLSIIKQIVASYHGRIRIESEEGVGTSVHVSLPMTRIDNPEATLKSPEELELLRVQEQTARNSIFIFNASPITQATSHEAISITYRAQDEILSTMAKISSDWLHLVRRSPESSHAWPSDIYVAMETDVVSGGFNLNNIKQIAPHLLQGPPWKPILLVCCRSIESVQSCRAVSHDMLSEHCIVGYLIQPCGIFKLVKMLAICLKLQQEAKHTCSREANPIALRQQIPVEDSTPKTPPKENVELELPNDARSKADNRSHAPVVTPLEPILSPKISVQTPGISSPPPASSGSPDNPASAPAAPQAKAPEEALQPKVDKPLGTFLLVDDNNINLKLLTTFLKRKSAQCLTAVDGQLALDAYKANPSACRTILMDISMPVMDGLTATREIRIHEKRNGLPRSRILMITGLASASVQQEATASGADGFITKPVRLKQLEVILEESRE